MPTLRFTKDHEWVRVEGDTAVIGITDYAQTQLGDVVYVELPEVGRTARAGQGGGGRRIGEGGERGLCARSRARWSRSTTALADDPAKVNADPMGDGWFFKMKLADAKELDGLMDEAAYQTFVEGAGLMRYLPLTDADRQRDAGRDRRRLDRCALRRRAEGRAPRRARSICRWRRASSRSSARWRRWRRRTSPPASVPFFLGAGAYRHHVPAAVDHLIQRGEFLTSYTPYQPEIAQGTLQSLFEFQTQVALLTGMEVANASLYDGATACAEAVMMANRVTRRGQGDAVRQPASALSRGRARPTRASPASSRRARDPIAAARRGPRSLIDGDTSCVVVQNPGLLRRAARLLARSPTRCHEAGALLVVVVTESVSLGAVKPPGAMGADIVAGEGQSLGNALNFGGPHLGLFATREQVCAPDAGPPRGETRRRRRQARLGADALDPRAAHPPREGDQQHLHQFGALRARLHRSIWRCSARRGCTGLAQLNHATACKLADRLAAVPGVAVRQRQLLQRVHAAPAASRRRPVVEALAERRHPRRRAGEPALSRARRARRICCWSRRPRPTTRGRYRPSSRTRSGRCCDERLEPGG